jgi:hypothetical protein
MLSKQFPTFNDIIPLLEHNSTFLNQNLTNEKFCHSDSCLYSNPNHHTGGWDQEDHSSGPGQEKVSKNPSQKNLDMMGHTSKTLLHGS